jgi:HPr kinase/phosphorylase
MRFHASCAARLGPDGTDALLLLGPPGSGKSDFVLRLVNRGFQLVADDQVLVEDGMARAPERLQGLLEVRGMGIFALPFVPEARLRLVLRMGVPSERLPAPLWHPELKLPEVMIDPAGASAPERAVLALEAACGRLKQVAGVFTA